MQISKAVAASPEDPNLNKLLLSAGKAVAEALKALTEASKGIMTSTMEKVMNKASSDIEDLAEKELKGAADVIERCVAKLNAATEAAKQRAAEKGIDIEEQNITGAILEAAQAIAKATAILMHAATGVQQEFQKLSKEPKSANVYKRDPTWAQGLISAARTVAGAVQHLVKAANDAAQGNASEEALIVAAREVSASTTQLVVASTVKADPNSESQRKLKEASGRVTAATTMLVNAAKAAAQWEEEKISQEDTNFNLAEGKIKEMEQQMEILRLEKELEKARGQLGTMRKKEYEQNVNKDFNASKPQGPPPQGGRGKNLVNWNANAMSGRPQAKPQPKA
jgi:talin